MKSKILLLSLLILALITSSFAVNVFDSQNNNDEIIEIFGDNNYLDVYSYTNLIFYNSSYDLQEGANFHLESNNLLYYVVSNNNNVNQNFVFVTIYRDGNNTYARGNNLNISAGGSEKVIVQPTKDYEYIATEIYCVSDSSTCGAGYQVRESLIVEEKEGIQTAFTPLINGVVDLITINLTIWRAIFYLFIFVVVSSIIVGIFKASFWLMDKSKQINEKDGFMSENTKKHEVHK